MKEASKQKNWEHPKWDPKWKQNWERYWRQKLENAKDIASSKWNTILEKILTSKKYYFLKISGLINIELRKQKKLIKHG